MGASAATAQPIALLARWLNLYNRAFDAIDERKVAMKKSLALLLAAAMMAGATGCVSQRRADDLQTLYRKSQEQILDLQAQLEAKDAEIAALRGSNPDSALLSERDRLRQALADAEARLREAGNQVALTPELDSALRQLAEQNPDLMAYDPELGMVKFRSDLTFALGSADVNPAAKDTLNRLASILTGDAAMGYEVRVVGHTDNVKIGNPATRQKHPTNWHLSAHRAISVKDVLESAGVQPTRLGVSGYGQFRPVATNGPKGAEQNRRVEIYLVQMPSTLSTDIATSEPTTPTAPAPAPQAEAPQPEMFK